MMSLKPYEEMNCLEVIIHWTRMKAKAPNGYSFFKSPNNSLWAIVDEQRNETLQMWDVNTGYLYRKQICGASEWLGKRLAFLKGFYGEELESSLEYAELKELESALPEYCTKGEKGLE
jgi:hypothetical protein